MDLKGQGDLCALRRRAGPAAVWRSRSPHPDTGWWRARATARSWGEFEKPRGRTVFALAPGAYVLRSSDGSQTLETSVTILEGGEATVTQADLTVGPAALTARKGGGPGVSLALAAAAEEARRRGGACRRCQGAALFARGSLGSDCFLGVLNCWTGSLAFNSASGAAGGSASFLENELTLHAGLGHHWASRRLEARLAVEAGLTEIRQSGVPSPSPRWSSEPFVGLRAEGAVALAEPLFRSLVLSGFAGPALADQETGWGLAPKLERQACKDRLRALTASALTAKNPPMSHP